MFFSFPAIIVMVAIEAVRNISKKNAVTPFSFFDAFIVG